MKLIRTLQVLCLVSFFTVVALAQPRGGEQRTVRMNVTVETSRGVRVEGLPIALAFGATSAIGRTNSNGTVTLSGSYPASRDHVYVVPMPYVSPDLSPSRDADVAKYVEVVNANTFDRMYRKDLVSGVEDYTITLTARPSFSVTARLLVNGSPISFSTIHANTIVPKEAGDGGGSVTVGGLPANDEAYVFLYPDDERIVCRHISQASPGSSVALGDIEIGIRPASRKINVHVNNVDQLKATTEKPSGRSRNLTLISADGQSTFGSNLNGLGDSVIDTRVDNPVLELPAGTYYACPGLLDGTGLPLKLLKLLQSGRAPDLDGAKAAKVVVPSVSGDPMSVTIDGVAAEAAISGVP